MCRIPVTVDVICFDKCDDPFRALFSGDYLDVMQQLIDRVGKETAMAVLE